MSRVECLSPSELSAFSLGELATETVEELAEHIDRCPACESALRELDELADPFVKNLKNLSELHAASTAPHSSSHDAPMPSRVGEYEIQSLLGSGGMGVVYKAQQQSLHRTVALKMLLGGGFVREENRARFRAEAAAVARLQHPNIVQIFEFGEWRPNDASPPAPYFALEFVEGGNLGSRIDGKPQTPAQAVAWVTTLARAVHYAHGQGIVHRDIKPSNVLLAADGQCKLCDFGVAKSLTGSSGLTATGLLVGTPEFMSPEQARGQSGDAGPATDVHALGALLYTLLTGRPPFQATSLLDTLDQVRSREPVAPRQLQPGIARDLDTICLKCLEKEPGRRYASAGELADDLQRHQDGEPIRARPVSAWMTAWKWAKRRPSLAAMSAAMFLVITLAFFLVAREWRRAEDSATAETTAKNLALANERKEYEARRQAERVSAAISLDQGANRCASGDVAQGLLWMVRSLELAVDVSEPDLERLARRNLAAWPPYLIRQRVECAHTNWAFAVAFSPDGRTVVSAGKDKKAQRWDVATGNAVGPPLVHPEPVAAVAYRPDGKVILTGSGDREGEARLWDAVTGEPARTDSGAVIPPLHHPNWVFSVAFSRDGARFLTVCPSQVRVWDSGSAEPVGAPIAHPAQMGQIAWINCALFSPNGKLVATGSVDGTACVWDAATGLRQGEPLEMSSPITALAFHPDGNILLAAAKDGTAQMWDVATTKKHGPPLRNAGQIRAVAFSPNGQLIATAGDVERKDANDSRRLRDGEVRLWDGATGAPIGDPLPHPSAVWSVAFSPQGSALLTGSLDGCARFFLTATGALIGKPLIQEGTVNAVVFGPDGRTAAATSAGGGGYAATRVWEVPITGAGSRTVVHTGQVTDLAFSPDGQSILTGADDGVMQISDYATGKPISPPLKHEGKVAAVGFSTDGQTMLSCCENGRNAGILRLWDRDRLRPRSGTHLPDAPRSAALVPGNSSALVVLAGGTVHEWNVTTGELRRLTEPEKPFVHSLQLDGSGQSIALGCRGAVQLLDSASLRLRFERTTSFGQSPQSPSQAPPSQARPAFHPDGRLLIATPELVEIWNPETDESSKLLPIHYEASIRSSSFSPDGQTILIGGDRDGAQMWDPFTGKPIGPPIGKPGGLVAKFSPDGRQAVAGVPDGRIAFWDVPGALDGTVEQVRAWIEAQTGMELDSHETIHALSRDAISARRRRLDELGGLGCLGGLCGSPAR